MCGIAGVLSLKPGLAPPTRETLARMAGMLLHRGPDEAGFYRDPQIGLAHTRLAIIDPAQGQQPLGDGRLQVVFNGEIFNHVELRRELSALGRVFRTASDTEVIVHAYQVWGEGCFQRFNGQWALALWDALEQRLVLSRDRFGIVPLYLAEQGGRLFFASEVKALFAGAVDLSRRIDVHGLDETFTFWSVVPPRTPFEGVDELIPGCVRAYQGGRVSQRRHAPERAQPGFEGTLEQAAEAVRDALAGATRLRMERSDVPVGCYLSGGIDSALIAALACDARGERMPTFSLRFTEREYDEGPFQARVVQHLGTRHHEVLASPERIAASVPEVIRHVERPILRMAPVPLFLLSRAVHEAGIKVVVTGEGADELFAGYDLFREAKVRRFWARDPTSRLRPRLLERLYPYLARSPMAAPAVGRAFFGRGLQSPGATGFAHRPRWDAARALRRLLSPDVRRRLEGEDCIARLLQALPPSFLELTPLAQDQELERSTLLTGYLLSSQGDRVQMAHAVEARYPFLDPAVVQLADALPDGYKLRGLKEKWVLKRAAAGLVPEEILARKKQPYRAPDAGALTGPGAPAWAEEALSDWALKAAGLFDPAAARTLWAKCRERGRGGPFSNADNMAITGVVSTQLLHLELVAAPPAPRAVQWKRSLECVPSQVSPSCRTS